MSNDIEHGMTVRERFALEFAKMVLDSDLRIIEKFAESKEAAHEGQTASIENFYLTCGQAARMADDMVVALKDEDPGWNYKHDDELDYSYVRPGLREKRMAECAADVAAAVGASKRRVTP